MHPPVGQSPDQESVYGAKGQFSPIREHVSQVLNGLVGFLGMLVPIGLDEDTDSDASSSD